MQLNSLETQIRTAFRGGFIKASWDTATTGQDAFISSEIFETTQAYNSMAQACVEPIKTAITTLANQLESAFKEGFAKGKTPGASYDTCWLESVSRKALYFETQETPGGLCPGNMPKKGEKWFIAAADSPNCQGVEVLDVSKFTVLVKGIGAMREERLCLDRIRFIEKVPDLKPSTDGS